MTPSSLFVRRLGPDITTSSFSSPHGYRATLISPVSLSAIYPRLIPGVVAGRECYQQLYANHRISPRYNAPCKLVYGCLTSYRKRCLDIVSVLRRGIDISCTSPDITSSKALPVCCCCCRTALSARFPPPGLYIACSSPLQCGWPQTRSRIALSTMSYCVELIVFSAHEVAAHGLSVRVCTQRGRQPPTLSHRFRRILRSIAGLIRRALGGGLRD